MKKFYLLIFMASIFMISCGGHFFNPRYYYNKNESASESEQEPPPDVGGGDVSVPEDQDPFKNGEWNDINYRFDGNKILEFLFGSSFDNNNVPSYKFYKDGKTWAVTDPLTSENYFDGTDAGNVAQGYTISPAKFYRYDYKNPLVAPESSYNQSDRMQRFLFYKVSGKAVIVPLNNYLIAVDKYSKLVFAYGKITKTKPAPVVGTPYPIAFEAVELHGDKRPFYEYDPIGFMSYDESQDKMTLTLYREYQNEMAKDANAYFPQVHDSSRAVAGYDNANSAGRSPYYMVNVDDIDPQTIIDQFKGKTYGIRDRLTLYTYKFSEDGLTLTVTVDHFYDGIVTKIYQCSKEVTGATSLKYGELTITGLGTYDRIKDGTREYILDYQDNGPAFVDRVAGKSYKAEDGSYEYKFNATGKGLDYYENRQYQKTYTFIEQDASDRAVYKYGSFMPYRGFRLDTHDGTKDGVLYMSGAAGSPALAPTDGITGNPGYLTVNIVGGGFIENVKGKTYKFRDYSEYQIDSPLPIEYVVTGKSLTSYVYEFTANGQTVNIREQVYGQAAKTISYNILSSSDKEAVYENNGVKVNLSIQNDNSRLYRDGKEVGDINFIDHGPLFPDRVRSARFVKDDVSYEFNDDGSEFTLRYGSGGWFDPKKEYKYKLARYDNSLDQNYTAVYECLNPNGAFKYGRVVLRNDNLIKTSAVLGDIGGLGTGESDLGLDYDAYRQ